MRILQGLSVAVFALLPLASRAVTIDLVTIGNPSNSSDITPQGLFGRVTTTYQIGKTEISNAQYVEFLNAKAATDSLGLYNSSMGTFSAGGIVRSGASGSYTYALKATAVGVGPGGSDYTYADKPVNYVSWYDAIRFANWMHNGQGSGSTETGAYTILGGTPIPTNADSISRNAAATWFLPSENQWYKAAYYNAASSSYYDYPTSSDTAPNNNLPSADTGNSANFLIDVNTTTGDPGYPLTPAGAYTLSLSPYGTLDQGGNVGEWNEVLVSANTRGRRGGDWTTTDSSLASFTRDSATAFVENNKTGFRLATLAAAVGVPGDYNSNGVVDAADYIVWRKNLGTSFQLPNEVTGTTPGSVTTEDYNAWRERFGNTSGSAAATGLATGTAVPEPVMGCALLIGLLLCIAMARSSARSTD
ncbi:MAG: SUMF1/EgtB/PvdO family nonheme iron enzyme [Pirellulales bacterium]|nr:SUMF1/EgtB/PvdO family nonheme iron enzyme [Pirellulales bacterium]